MLHVLWMEQGLKGIDGALIIFTFSPLISEEKIDIWKNKKKPITETSNLEDKEGTKNLNLNTKLF